MVPSCSDVACEAFQDRFAMKAPCSNDGDSVIDHSGRCGDADLFHRDGELQCLDGICHVPDLSDAVLESRGRGEVSHLEVANQ